MQGRISSREGNWGAGELSEDRQNKEDAQKIDLLLCEVKTKKRSGY